MMKILQILVLIFGLAIFVNAQNTVLRGTVYDINKARVVGAEILIKDTNNKIYKTKTNDSGEYEINLPFGKYTIEVSQIGFKVLRVIDLELNLATKRTLDITLESGRCEDCNGAIYGERQDDYSILSGVIYDSNGAVIANALIISRDLSNKEKIVKSGKDGNYKIVLENGLYSIEINAEGFKPFKIEKYKITGTRNGMNFDVVLEVRSCDDPKINCDSITANPIKNN